MNNINNNNLKTKLLFGNLSNSERDLYNEISHLVDIPDVMRILDSSHFFMKEYLQQEFKQSSRFKIDKIHPNGIPLKESHEKRLKKNGKNSVKLSSYNKKNEELELRLSNFVEQKPKLRYFTMGSKQHPKQFENWSPEEMYNWWLKLRTSDIPKLEWKILDAVFFLFINQISCICNSYIRYGIKNNSNNKKVFKEELRLLSEYFRLLDEFYKSGGEYGKLLDTHIAFCYWFHFRIRYDREFKLYVEYEKSNFNFNIVNLYNDKTSNIIEYKSINESNELASDILNSFKKIRNQIKDNNFSLFLFTSYVQYPSKYINLYSVPIITCPGIPTKTHSGDYYSPISQISHDIFVHVNILIKYLVNLYKNINNSNIDISIFKTKMLFLKLLSNKKYYDAQLLFWLLINEYNFNINIFKSYIKLQKLSNRNSFIREILSKYTSNINKELQYLQITDKNISKFFDIEFLLKQLKILKILIIELITSENKKDVVKRLLDSIDVLIETCEETIEIVKNERQKNYNNYMRN